MQKFNGLSLGLLMAIFLTLNSHSAENLKCDGQTTSGFRVEVSGSIKDAGTPLLVQIKNPENLLVVKEEVFQTRLSVFNVGSTSYKYFIVELLDNESKNAGLLQIRSALCTSHNDMNCESNAELSLNGNAAFPYRLKCSFN
jgi:hypothetical protein